MWSFPRLAAAVVLLASTQAAGAAEKHSFTSKAFGAAQSAGESILVQIHASWCPVCKKQKVILNELESAAKFDGLKVLEVDFDKQKNVVKTFAVTNQSTLIAFKSGRETGRLVGTTDPEKIADLLEKTL
ncbi:Thioredoxin [Methylocapsa aurea]|uniref:thioredoxin family protein n=1 Tax=Methylocapsa aurea TaxID=663610 RepID=UPI003D18A743